MMGSDSAWSIKGDAEWGIQPHKTTEFTRVHTSESVEEDWPISWGEVMLEGWDAREVWD